jgi:hypothetical protein
MRLIHLDTYKRFVSAGRPYYPTESNRGLLVTNIAVNCQDARFGHKRRLQISHYVLQNYGGFCAVQCAWISRYGYRVRWFYWQDGKRVTFRRLTWDNKIKVCQSWVSALRSHLDCDFDYPPCRDYLSFAFQKGYRNVAAR